ncbi:MAG: hypothetical protein QXQ84_05725 [Nitrososphaerota archaeon]
MSFPSFFCLSLGGSLLRTSPKHLENSSMKSSSLTLAPTSYMLFSFLTAHPSPATTPITYASLEDGSKKSIEGILHPLNGL